MTDVPEDWSFWRLASPARAARIVTEMYPGQAKLVVMRNIIAAERDQRPEDRWYWLAVLVRLHGRNLDGWCRVRSVRSGTPQRTPSPACRPPAST